MVTQLKPRGARAPEGLGRRLRIRPGNAGPVGAPEGGPRSSPRVGDMSRPGGNEDGTPWWVGAILVAIFGMAMFLSGLIVGFNLG